MFLTTVDPYQAGMLKTNTYADKVKITGNLVVVLDGELDGRKLSLIKPPSRALCRNEVHELIATDEKDAGPGKVVNSIAYLGFVEVEQGGVALVGDKLRVGDLEIGHVAGFDETHMPNHLNIVIKVDKKLSGKSLQLRLGMPVTFTQA